MKTTLNLTGYQETETIYGGTRTVVYRAVRLSDQQPVIIKVLRNPTPHFNELVQFRNQYVITCNLDSPYVVHPLSLEHYGPGEALVMPDDGSRSLFEYWQTQGVRTEIGESAWNRTAQLTEFLHIAIQLADALHYLNQQRIIHKDIKPANILIHPATQQIQLIDFSIASLLPKEQQQLVNPQVLEGTLAYISPEQTGRMNRGLDYRTDFYSLGVTLYELLTGMLPFSLSDPLALVHCHIAQTAIAPLDLLDAQGQPYPAMLSATIIKLMAKNAEDRYQSALGLKHDLERCLQSLEATGAIAEFELGERDVCDRFLISEKLYGREAEVQALLDAFDRVAAPNSEPKTQNSELLLVAGYSGIGKTAIINEVHKPIVKKRGYFIKGKFDQFNRNIPLSAFVQAFRDLMGQLLSESDEELRNWTAKILDAVGENGQVLIEVIPELERVIGQQPQAPELSGTAAQNRFNLLFEKFIGVFTSPDHPLVIFLDDLQWADSASLGLLKVLMGEGRVAYLLLLGAYRDNEVFPAHPLMLTLDELDQQGATVATITLLPLISGQVNQLVAETLSCSEAIAQPLTELVYQKAKGNPFFTRQFLKGLHEDQFITYNLALGHWDCDLSQVKAQALTDDVVVFMGQRLQKLSLETQAILKRAACIGNQFDLKTIAIICEHSADEVAATLWDALKEGIILPQNEAYKFFQGLQGEQKLLSNVSVGYRFLHDRIQQAAYRLIPDQQRQIAHLKIGQLLLNNAPTEQQEGSLFNIVGQLNLGADLITSQTERDRLAQLNWQAAQKAQASTAYKAAFDYCLQGYQLLGSEAWQRDYPLTLNLATGATENAYLHADFEQMDVWLEQTIDHTRDLLDRVKLYELQLLALMSKGQPLQSVQTANTVLAQLGVELPEMPTPDYIEAELAETARRTQQYSLSELMELPRMTDPYKIAALRILGLVIPPTTVAAPALLPLNISQQVRLCLDYGNGDFAAYAYISYAFFLSGIAGDSPQGYQFGRLALQYQAQHPNRNLEAKVAMVFYAFVSFQNEHLRESLSPLKAAYRVGLDVGDLEYAGYSAIIYCLNSLLLGRPLSDITAEIKIYEAFCRQIKFETVLVQFEIVHQAALNFAGHGVNPAELTGTAYNRETRLPQQEQSNNQGSLFYAYVMQIWLSVLFGHPENAIAQADRSESYAVNLPKLTAAPSFWLYDALARLAVWSTADQTRRQQLAERIHQTHQKFESWAVHAPMNYQHCLALIEAEIAYHIKGDRTSAMELYEQAIAGAKANKYLQEEGLANELAAKFYLDWDKQKFAALYMQEAYYCYSRWEAKAKTDHLEAHYPDLLAPILQQQQLEFNALDSLSSLTRTVTASIQMPTSSSSTSISDALDFATILQAAQTLSSTIELEQLLGEIVQIMLTNAGAQKTVLLTPEPSQWQLRANTKITADGQQITQTQTHPLTAESPVPIRLIQYVKNTQEPVLINAAQTEITGILEGYLLKHHPQSVLCVPLLNQGNLVAIVYLEHPTTKDVFTPNRQTIIEFLCAQAASALQNAQLYHQAQTALTDLKEAQLQLVQSEKMSALGNLVAGVAHEINNPVGFLKGNIQPAQEYVQDLLGLIDLYHEKLPNPDTDIEDEIEAIDLEFVREDLPQLIGSMDAGVDRIRNISDSLRTFSRKDQEHKTAFNLHDGIDSTLLILKHRTKANEQRPKVEVAKNYGELPDVHCFPGQLNQVFMNILANAIDAFDEANQGKTYQEIEANPNTITIATSVVDEQVQIQIQDNGCGMEPETVERIFEQGFTTKEVGKGTGLGMAIAHQIITEKHGGTLTCTSEPGQGTTFAIRLPHAV